MIGTATQRGIDEHERVHRAQGVWPYLGALCGILFVICELGGIVVLSAAGWANPGAPRNAIARVFLSAPSPTMRLGEALEILSALLFVLFAGRLYADLRRAEGGTGWLSTVAFGAALLFAGVQLAGDAAFGALALRAGHGLDVAEAMTLFDLGQFFYVLDWAACSLFLLAVAAVVVRERAFSVWIGWSGVALSAGFLIGVVLPTTGIADIPATLFYVWLVALSAVLIRRSMAHRSTVQGAEVA